MTSGYEYRGLIAASWDLLRGDTSTWADRPFYRDVILRSGQPALDVGCGTGRLLLDYLAAGIDIDGVDNSSEMLALCRQKAARQGLAPTIYEAAMEELTLPRTYRTIIVPSSSFQLVTDPVLAARTLSRFLEHLEPGGTLVMSLMLLGPPGTVAGNVAMDRRQIGEAARPEDGSVVRRRTRSTYDLDERLEHTEDWYEVIRDGVVVASEHHQRSPATRWYTQQEAHALVEAAGFVGVHLTHGFTTEPARPDDRIFCVLGTRGT